MLYTIIPPILIVLSVIGIIIFLVKKSSRVAMLEHEERARALEEENFPSGRIGRDQISRREAALSGIKQGGLVFLEKITKRLRLIFLRLENKLTHWGEAVRSRRKKREDSDEEILLSKTSENEILDRVKQYDKREMDEIDVPVPSRRPEQPSLEKEREMRMSRPMVSERVAVPRRQVESKDQLEKILIERIAANPKDTEAYARLGEYYWEISNLEYAKECFKQIVKLEPGNANVKNKLKRLERMLGRR